MNAAVHSEPNKLPAGLLALLVHGIFFALLYLGISWRNEPPAGMVVDIWDSLPAPKIAPAKVEPPPAPPPPKPAEPRKIAEPPRPAAPPKADIELKDKKKSAAKPVEEKKPEPPRKAEPAPPDPKVLAEQAAQAEQERVRAAQAAALGKMLDDYKSRIIAKIRRNIAMPQDVPDNIRAEFDVILLPGGSVLSARLIKPSGNAAYDSAVERAIARAQPLPLPADISTFNKFRELHLKFCPVEIDGACK